MNKINNYKINKSDFNAIKPRVKEAKTMEQKVEQIIKEVSNRALREVPEFGDFAPVYAEFKNTDLALEATDFMLKITSPGKTTNQDKTIRNIELIAYKIPTPYKISKLIATGSKEEILKELENPDFCKKVEESFKSMSRNLSDI